ncbi:rotatin-like [Ptychodera flava]|uniref:rotatin-like n=1 Tax=Ptychodera flava TaxID=63121 RepID=UPI00396A300B
MQPVRSDVNLRPLFTKLGHQLEEIRVRSLTNIISKLDHNVICEADLVQEKYFLIRLLEWFNYPTVPMQDDVISMLERLSKHSSAAKILVDIGGVEFLSQLRPNSEPKLQVIIDRTLENLFSLPEIGEAEHRRECIYHQSSPSQDETAASAAINSKCTDGISQIQHSQISHSHSSKPFYDIQEPQVGYFIQDQRQSTLDPATRQSQAPQASDYEMTSCFQFSTFPWLPLTSTDRHVLTSTDSSLRSPNPTLVGSSCEFLTEVVLQDFPAEIFLQRPSIVQSLLALLKLKPPHDHSLPLSAVKCLEDLSIDLVSRIIFYHDPALYCPKQVDFGFGSGGSSSSHSNATLQSSLSSGSRPSVLGHSGPRLRGDGQDGDSSSATTTPTPSPRQPAASPESESDVETDSEDMIALQFSQITVPQFCVLVLEHATPLLKTSNGEMVLHCTQLLNGVLELLKLAVSPEIWDEKSVVAREVAEKLVDVLEVLGDVLLYHHHSRSNLSDGVSEHDIIQHRLAFITVTAYVTQFLEALMPVEKAKDLFPESLNTALGIIVMDSSLCLTYPCFQSIAIKYITETDEKQYQIYSAAKSVCESMEATCRFLKTANDEDENSLQVQISRADQALNSVPYHSHMPLVETFVTMCSEICKPANANPNLVAECRRVLLKYLAHPISKVKIHTYLMCLNIVKDALGITEATTPGSVSCFKIKFLLDPRITREIAAYGVSDAEDQVSLTAREILLYLLQGKVLMGSGLWSQVVEAMVPVLPILQAYADKQTNLGSCIIGMTHRSAESEDESLLPNLEQLRSTLRLMFSKCTSVRSETIKYILAFLATEDDSINKLPSLTQATLTDMGNLLIMDQPIVLDNEQKSVFQVDGLIKVYNIVTSATVELEVRKSAAEQLAVILQDVTLHQAFMKHNGLEKIMDLIKSALIKPAESREQEQVVFIPACLTVLRQLIHQDYSLRHQLAHDFTIYFVLIRSALLFATDDRVRYEASHILTLLLFDEVASLEGQSSSANFEIKRNGFSLPKCVIERYRLPFKAHSQPSLSPHRVDVPPSSDPLATGPPAEMLTMGWNIAWHHGIARLATFVKKGKKQKEDGFASKLHLSRVERLLLSCTHTSTGILQCLEAMLTASSHFAVKTALSRLEHYIVTERIGVGMDGNGSSLASKSMLELDWKEAFGRFLQVIPANMEDETLLAQILHFMSVLLDTSNGIPEEFLTWLADIIVDNHAPLTRLLQKSESYGETAEEEDSTCKRALNKSILVFLSAFVKKLTKFNHTWKFGNGIGCIGGDVTNAMIQSLHLADAVHFYNLPSLEGTLQCLVHVTARPGWSNGCMDIDNLSLCHKFLTSLLEVVSAFHVGRGGTAMSYMGKGVTKSATMCLLHLAFEMSQYSTDKSWTSHWLYIRQGNKDELMSTGLVWLLSLWYYRDPEVRATGLAIATALSSTEPGRIMLSSCCQQIPGGLWGTVLTFLLDQSECSIVRQQAAALFVNLTSQLMPSTAVSDPSVKWQGPSVQDEETQVSLVGLPALIALLHHYQFYPEIVSMLNNYYADSTIAPVSIMDDVSASSSSVTQATASPSTLITTVENGTFNASHVTSANATQEQRSSTIYTSTPNTTRTSGGATVTPTATTSTTSQQTNSVVSSRRSSQPQGTSSTSSQSSAATPTSAADVRYPSVVTPSLIGTMCQSLRNLLCLAPQDTLMSINKQGILKNLLRLLDVDLLESRLQQLDCKDGILLVDSLFMMYSETAQLIRAIIMCDSSTRKSLLQDGIIWRKLLQLIGLFRRQNIIDAGLESSCHGLLSSVFQLLMTMIQLEQRNGVKELTPFLAKFWTNVVDCIVHVVSSSTSSSSTRQAAMNFLTALLTEEGRNNQQEKNSESITVRILLDGEEKDNTDKQENKPSGEVLCEVLLTAADGNLPTSSSATTPEKTSTMNALSTLLAWSQTAKHTAMQAGLVESTVDQIKHIHVKLNMDSLQLGKTSKKKEDPLMANLINHLNLLQNFMYDSETVKMVAYQCGLSDVAHKLWSWCTVEPNLMLTMLSLLSTYTARCDTTCKSLAYTSPTSLSSTGPSNNSLVHSLVKFASREHNKNKHGECGETQRSLFSLLSTLVLSSECRGILWKSNFLQSFSKVPIPKKGSKSKKFGVSSLWLKLLVNLSFSSEGQQMIMKIPDSLELLLEYVQCNHQPVQLAALLVLRNLCFHGTCKPKLLASDKFLPYFLDAIHNLCLQMKYTAVTALWALVHNSQKAKVSLKNGAVGPKLMEAYSKIKDTTYSPVEEQQYSAPCLNAIQTVISLVNE